jgi:hypothetical protein
MSALSDRVVAVTKKYYGPAAEPFLARQCKSHLKIQLAELSSSHLPELAKWIEISGRTNMDEGKGRELADLVAAL